MFAGIGGFREGLTRAGDFVCVGHCEIDKHADRSYRALFDMEGEWFLDDIRKADPADLPDFDLLCGGFPCQSFSIAGSRGGFDDPRGTLFFELARLAEAGTLSTGWLKMFPACSTMTAGGHLRPSCAKWKSWGILSNGRFLTAQISVYRRQESACTLSDILMNDVEEKYFLSPREPRSCCTAPASEPGRAIKCATKKGYQTARVGDSIDLSYATSNTRRGACGARHRAHADGLRQTRHTVLCRPER